VLTADGAGDDLCATVNIADERGNLRRLAAVGESHSPAMVYLTVTALLGMVPNEHEYKLMGMAPYASAGGAEEVCGIFRAAFRVAIRVSRWPGAAARRFRIRTIYTIISETN